MGTCLVGFFCIALQLTAYRSAEAQACSVEVESVDASGGFPPGDGSLVPGPAPVLVGGTGLEINGFSYASHGTFEPGFLEFSVDGASVGASGSAVLVESGCRAGGDLRLRLPVSVKPFVC